MAKEVKVKITSENKELLTMIAGSIAGLKRFAASVSGINDIKTGTDGITVSLKKTETAANSAGNSIKKIGSEGKEALNNAKSASTAFGQSLANVTIIANGVFTVLEKLKDAVKTAVAPGTEYTKMVDSMRIGTAGILMSMTKINGRQLELNEALAISEQTFQKLQERSLQFNLNINDTSQAFQAIVAPALATEMSMDQIVALSVQGTKAVKSMMAGSSNVGMQISQELRAMLTGDIDQNSTVAKALGITAADIEEAKASAGGLFAYLTEKMKGFTLVAGEIPKTISGKMDMLQTAFSMISNKGFAPLIDMAKDWADDLIKYLVITTTKTDEFGNTIKDVKMNPELIDKLRNVSEYLVTLAQKGSNMATTLYNLLSPLLPLLKFLANHILTITVLFGGWLAVKAVIPILTGINTAGIALVKTYTAVTTAIRAGAVATQAAAGAMTGLKVAIRGLMASTVIGLLAVGVGMLAEKMLNLADNTNKAADASRNFGSGANRASSKLGSVSQPYESGEAGAGSVSSGANDPGGVSYGLHQINSDNIAGFVQWLVNEGYDAGRYLSTGEDKTAGIPAHDVVIGSDEFQQLWKNSAEKYGQSFADAQYKYLKENWYDVTANQLANDNFDLSKHSFGLQSAVWSTAIQHGPTTATNIVEQALNSLDNNTSAGDDADLIKAIFDLRSTLIANDKYLDQETKDSIINNRYTAELQDTLAAGTTNSIKMPTGTTDLTLADKKAQKEAILRAQMANNIAMAETTAEQYIAQLEVDSNKNEQEYKLGNIGIEAYHARIREILIAKTTAEIKVLEKQVQEQLNLQQQKGLQKEDKIASDTEVKKLQSAIEVKKKNLSNLLSSDVFTQQEDTLAETDKAYDAWIGLLTLQGKIVEAVNLKQKNSTTQLEIAKLKASDFKDAAAAMEKTQASEVIKAQVTEATTNIGYVEEDMSRAQGMLIQQVIDGTISLSDAVNKFTTEYGTKTEADLTKLKEALMSAKSIGWEAEVREIDGILRNMKKYVGEFGTSLVSSLDDAMQNKINQINANLDLTPMQKEDDIAEVKRKNAAVKLSQLYAESGGVPSAPQQRAIDLLTAQITQMDRLADVTDRVGVAAKNSFEDGLLTFLSDGITKCKTLGEAFRNLAISVVSSIQRIYSEALTKDIMKALGLTALTPSSKSAYPSINGAPVIGPLKADGSFSEGGDLTASGIIRGPGTSTSDSIMAYIANLGRIINVSDGEGILTGKAMRNIGSNALAALNAGVDPRRIFKSYATGGSLSDSGSTLTGPQELAATLSSGDTNLHLKNVNVFDMNEIGKYIQSRAGEKVLLNFMKNNANAVQQLITIRG